jgi:O-antigen ligase
MRQGDSRRWLVLVFLAGFMFLILTKSRTSCAGLLVSLCPLWALRSSRGKLALGLMGTAWVASSCLLLLLFMDVDVAGNASNAALMGREEQAESLTGRLPIWEAILPYVQQGYVLGYGYDSFWVPGRVSQISSELHWGIREAHSAYIDTILSVGLIGGGVFLLAILISLLKSATHYLRTNDSSYGFLFGLYVFGLINAFTESGMMMPMFVPFIGLAGMVHLACFDRESPPSRGVWSSHPVPATALS